VLALLAVAAGLLRDLISWGSLACALAVAAILCLAWPYFPMLDLVRASPDLGSLNQSMYRDVLLRIFPALPGLVVIVQRTRVDRRDLLGLFLAASAGLWLVGALTGDTSYGRSLSFLVLVLDIALADGVGRVEATTRLRDASPRVRLAAAGLACLVLFGVVTTSVGWIRMVPKPLLPASVRYAEQLVRPDEQLALLVGLVGRTDVVVGSNQRDNNVIPALAGRTLALSVPRPFVADADARRAAEREILDPATDAARRRATLEQYDVRFLLLHISDPRDRALLERLQADGATIVAQENGRVLVEVGRLRANDP
jgi:hypothetical protein